MREFITTQYELYCVNRATISLDLIKELAEMYLSTEERNQIFNYKKD